MQTDILDAKLNINRIYRTLNWQELHTATFDFDQAFRLNLADGQYFLADTILRIIPKRRLVALGTWQGKAVIAKVFFNDQHAKRQMEKDQAGAKILNQNHIPTPIIYYAGVSADRRSYILIFEYINHAKSLEEIWCNQQGCYPQKILQNVMYELATQHVFGVLQHDLHLKNFLLTDKKIYMLDGAEVALHPPLLSKKLSMENLAVFLAQLGVGIEAQQESLFRFYAKARGWLLKKEEIVHLFARIKQLNIERWRKFSKKIVRNSTNFAKIHHRQLHGMYDRQYQSTTFLKFLSDPESAFKHPDATILKAGRSSTVIKLTLDQRVLVIKRYNIKTVWHGLRRAFRVTRAYHSWRLSQKLQLFCTSTARPVAFIEKTILCLRRESYYVTEYISSETAATFFKRQDLDAETISEMIKKIVTLLKSLAKLNLTHGDLKLTNILIDPYQQPVLIDFDGAKEYLFSKTLKATWKKEIARLLHNFDQQPLIKKQFSIALENFWDNY